MARSRTLIIVAAVVLVLVVVGVVGFITPGYVRYDYKTMDMGMFGAQQIRTDRFTGKTEIQGAGKWQPIEINKGKISVPQNTTIQVK